MLSIFWRTIRDRKYSVIIYSTASVILLEMYIALFPALKEQSAEMAKLLETYPESMWKAFNIDPSSLTFDKVGPFLAMKQFNFVWPILAFIFVIGFAGYALANEIEKGTIEVLLAQPVSRAKAFVSRYLAGLTNLAIFTAISVLAIIPLTAIHGVEIEIDGVFALAFISLLFAWAVYAISFVASAVFSEKSRVAMIGGGLLILMYVTNIIAGLKENLSDLKYLSFFYYYNPARTIEQVEFVPYSLLVFGGVIVIFSLIAFFWFNRRDIAV